MITLLSLAFFILVFLNYFSLKQRDALRQLLAAEMHKNAQNETDKVNLRKVIQEKDEIIKNWSTIAKNTAPKSPEFKNAIIEEKDRIVKDPTAAPPITPNLTVKTTMI